MLLVSGAVAPSSPFRCSALARSTLLCSPDLAIHATGLNGVDEMSQSGVLGIYLAHTSTQGSQLSPALQQSTELFKALVSDDLNAFESALGSASTNTWHTVLYVSGADEEGAAPKVEAKSRTLSMLAIQHNALRVLAFLLSKGADPGLLSADGLSAYQFIDSAHANAPTIRAMLDDARGNWTVVRDRASTAQPPAGEQQQQQEQQQPTERDAVSTQQQEQQGTSDVAQQQADTGLAPGASDLTRPEYSTDWFRMYCFKVLRCSKRYAHDWRACPFAHPTENARRRDPREFKYSSLVCPDYRQGCCVRGDTCQYAHGVFESWLHPSRYRTQLCKDQENCDRPVCFFAHTLEELRAPADCFVPGPEERLRVPEAMQVVLGIASPTTLLPLQQGLDTARAVDQYQQQQQQQQQQSQLDVLGPQQLRMASGSSAGNLGASCSSNASASSSTAGLAGQGGQDAAAAAGSDTAGTSGGGGAGGASPVPKQQQLVSPTAMPVPRMSNAFARKHGLDPKENPLINLQRLAMQQQPQGPQQQQSAGSSSGGRRSKRGSRQQQHSPVVQPQLSPQQQQQQMALQQPLQQQHFAQAAYSPQAYQQQQYQQYQQMYQQHSLPPLSPQPPMLQPLTLQAPPALLQPPPMSPAGAAYYSSPGAMQPMAPSPGQQMLDPQSMSLLFGGMSLGPGGPISPAGAAEGMVAAGGGGMMASPQMQQMGYALAAPSPTMLGPGMLSPMSLTPSGAGLLGPASPLPGFISPGGAGLTSPHPPPF